MSFRVQVHSQGAIVRDRAFTGARVAAAYYRAQVEAFAGEKGISVYLEEREGNKWITRKVAA
jgi:hypothetical protein